MVKKKTKKVVKKAVPKKVKLKKLVARKKAPIIKKSIKTKVGEITHFFDKISVAVVKVVAPIKIGDKISIEGNGTHFEQKVSSMQVDRKTIEEAKKGQDIGMKADWPVREKDVIYKI